MPAPTLADLPSPPPGRAGWPWAEESRPLPPAMPGGAPWPRITIVTPSFNQAEFVEETLRSVLLQGYPSLEYIVLDGGSSDNSVAVIGQYAGWLAYWHSRPDRGQSHALNEGFRRGTGEVCGWLNSDDFLLPGALGAAAQALAENPDAALIYGDARQIGHGGRALGRAGQVRQADRRALLEHGNFIAQPSAFFRREAFWAAGGLDESLGYTMDWDLWLRLYAQGRVVYLPQPLSGMRLHPQAKTFSDLPRQFAEVRQVVERHGGHGLPAQVEAWLVSSGLGRAFAAYRRGDLAAGRDELGYVLQNAPAWRSDAPRLAREIAGRAWSVLPGLTGDERLPLEFASRVCGCLPAEVEAPAAVRRQAFALLHEALAFRSHRRCEPGAVRNHAWRAVAADPGRLKNRGLWAVVARSTFGLDSSAVRLPVAGEALRAAALDWLKTMQAGPGEPGRYRLCASSAEPALAASCWAALLLALLDGLETLAPGDRERWTAYLQAHQPPGDGAFDDPLLRSAEGLPAGYDPQFASWQSTFLSAAALGALGGAWAYPLEFLAPFRSADFACEWLERQDWSNPFWLTSDWSNPWLTGRRVLYLGSLLLQAGERAGDPAYARAVHRLLDCLEARQNPQTGCWDLGRGISPQDAVAGASHLSLLYYYAGRPMRYAERLIDSALALQHTDGLFDPRGGGDALADWCAVDLLVKLSLLTDHRAGDIRTALAHACRAILECRNPDGGFCEARRPGEAAPLDGWAGLRCRADESNLHAAWLRLLALALIASRYPGEFVQGGRWRFARFPGPGWHDPARLQAVAAQGRP